MRYPLIAPLAAFSAGIWAAQYAAFSFRELSSSILLLLVLALLGLARGTTRGSFAACLTGFGLAGALWTSLPKPPEPNRITAIVENKDLRTPLRLRGWVCVPPTVRLDRDQFALAVESLGDNPATGGVRVTVARRPDQSPLGLHYGDRIEFPARLRQLRNYENPGGFDRVNFLIHNEIHMTATVRAGAPVRRLEGRSGSRLMGAVWRAREWAEYRTDVLLGPNSTDAGLVKAMVLGDGAYLDRAMGVSFQRTGTYHALVVSGSHVALLAWFFLLLFRHLRVPSGFAALVTMALMIGFVLLVGSQLPAIRAAGMIGTYLVARQFYRERRALNIMAGTALGMILWDPSNLFDVSFQLSFLCVALIAGLAAPIIDRTLQPYRLALVDLPNRDRDIHLPPKVAQTRIEWRMLVDRLPFSTRLSSLMLCSFVRFGVEAGQVAIVSAAVQLGLTLPMAIYFHRISWSGLSANLFVAPLLSLVVPVGFLAILTGWSVLGKALSLIVHLMVATVAWHARLTWLETRVPLPPFWLSFLFAAALIGFAWSIGRRPVIRTSAFLLLLAAVAGLIIHPFAPRLDPGRLELTALDVGQGDALFLALPAGQTMLLDGGGISTFGGGPTQAPDIGEEVVSPYLWSRSIRSLDVVAISHAHYDHIGGIPVLLENFRVRELWVGTNPPSPEYNRLLDTARRRGVRVVRLSRGDVRSLGGVTFQVLGPPPDYVPPKSPSNDDSLVLLARFGERRFLLTGDIEWRSERRLVEDGVLPSVDVLKVPHHGSRTSSTDFLLAAAKPWLALISAGFDNPYGHPHPDVVKRLAGRRMEILRTDRDGLVTVSTDGRRVQVWCYRWR